MSKYIIKNCGNCYFYEDDGYYCEFQKDNTMFVNPCKDSSCLLKQITDKCREKVSDDICLNCNDFEAQKTCYECDLEHHREDIYHKRANVCFAEEILTMLEIEECEQ